MNPEALLQPAPDAGSGVNAENPWPGLVAFTEDLQDFFHGRAREADELLRRVDRKRLTVLFGQSGLGKSSLLHAGLFPRLRAAGFLPVSIRLDHSAAAPPPARQVMAAASPGDRRRPEATPTPPSRSQTTLFGPISTAASLPLKTADGRPIRLVLVFDQFEELFAIGQAKDETRERTAQFLTELADLVEDRVPEAFEERLEETPELINQFVLDDRDYRLLICLREDYLPELESLGRHDAVALLRTGCA